MQNSTHTYNDKIDHPDTATLTLTPRNTTMHTKTHTHKHTGTHTHTNTHIHTGTDTQAHNDKKDHLYTWGWANVNIQVLVYHPFATFT